MKKPILKTKRSVSTAKRAKAKAPESPTIAAWREWNKLSPKEQAKLNAIARPVLDQWADENRKTLRVDPTGKHNPHLSSMLGRLLFGKPPADYLEFVGTFLVDGITGLSADELEAEFSAIVAMKREAAKAKAGTLRKSAQWSALRNTFKRKFGRHPESKGEFSDYADRVKCPMPASASGKTRIYKLLGMTHLPQKHGGKK